MSTEIALAQSAQPAKSTQQIPSPSQVQTSHSQATTYLSWGLIGGTVMVAGLVRLLGIDLPGWVQYAPFVVSALLLGLPHGAVDHFVPFWVTGRPITAGRMAGIVAIYVALAGLYMGWWIVSPATAFVGFIVMTWLHWGQGDRHAVVHLHGGRHVTTQAQGWALGAVRGGLPMIVPLLSHPSVYQEVALATTTLFGLGTAASLDWFFTTQARWLLGSGFGLLVLGSLAASWPGLGAYGGVQDDELRAMKWISWRRDLLETGLLLLFFVVVPPLLAVGIYFCFWHALRHIERLQRLEPVMAAGVAAGRSSQAKRWLRFFALSAPLTVAALGLLVGLYVVVPNPPTDMAGFLGLYLALIAALTFPHTLLVSWMDLRPGA